MVRIGIDKQGDWEYGTELSWVRQPLWSGSQAADRCDRFQGEGLDGSL